MATPSIGSQVFGLTSRGALMPATVVGFDGACPVLSTTEGRRYTFAPTNVVDEIEAREMMYHRRAEEMVKGGYQIALRLDGAFHVYEPRKHGRTGGYIVREITSTILRCNCPCWAEHCDCKHVRAVPLLLHARAATEMRNGREKFAATYRYIALHGIALAAVYLAQEAADFETTTTAQCEPADDPGYDLVAADAFILATDAYFSQAVAS